MYLFLVCLKKHIRGVQIVCVQQPRSYQFYLNCSYYYKQMLIKSINAFSYVSPHFLMRSVTNALHFLFFLFLPPMARFVGRNCSVELSVVLNPWQHSGKQENPTDPLKMSRGLEIWFQNTGIYIHMVNIHEHFPLNITRTFS